MVRKYKLKVTCPDPHTVLIELRKRHFLFWYRTVDFQRMGKYPAHFKGIFDITCKDLFNRNGVKGFHVGYPARLPFGVTINYKNLYK